MLLALVGIWAVLWPLTDLLAVHDVGAVTGPGRVLRLQSAYEAVRTQLLTLGAGVFAAGALIYTARNFTLARRAHVLTEQGQVTDRYTKAIEQLGSAAMDVRIGGIFALERIARDSARDHPTVMEVLAAFIRNHSPEQWPQPAALWAPLRSALVRFALLRIVPVRLASVRFAPVRFAPVRSAPARRTWTRFAWNSSALGVPSWLARYATSRRGWHRGARSR